MFPTNREIWKSINGYANYEVSCFGRVRNATTERILKPGLASSGYLSVCLSKNSKGKSHNIHKLVASEFLDNPLNKPCVDHVDGDKTNNNLDDLRLCSYSQNGGHRKKQANASSIFKGVDFHKKANKWRARIEIDGRKKYLGLFLDEKEAAQAYNEKAKELFKEFAKLNIIED